MKNIVIGLSLSIYALAQNSDIQMQELATNWDQLCSDYADLYPLYCAVSVSIIIYQILVQEFESWGELCPYEGYPQTCECSVYKCDIAAWQFTFYAKN